MKVYIRKKSLNESQGVDEDIAREAKVLAKSIIKALSGYKGDREEFCFSEPVTVSMPIDERKWGRDRLDLKIAVIAAFNFYKAGDKAYGKSVNSGAYGEAFSARPTPDGNGYNGYVAVNLKLMKEDGKLTYGFLIALLSHEMLHIKSTLRENLEAAIGKTLPLRNAMNSTDNWGVFNYVKYMLSPNEMKSYVQQMYHEAKSSNCSLDPQRWAKETLPTLQSWQNYKSALKGMKEIGDDEVADFLEMYAGPSLKHMTGISTPADFRRYFNKAAKDFGLKLLKAAYKGYTDALKENGIKESAKEYYKIYADRLCESQGTDDDVNRLTADLTEKIMKGYEERRLMTFDFRMDVDYTDNGARKTISVPVELTPDYFPDLGVEQADTDDVYWGRNHEWPIYIRVSLKGGKKVNRPAISDTVSHELMHVKTLVREAMERRRDATWMFVNKRRGDDLGFLQYFLSKNEMSSYVQGMYFKCRYATEKILREKGRRPTRREFTDVVRKSMEWKYAQECEAIIDGAEADDIEDRISQQNNSEQDYDLRRYTGIGSSHASFRRYYYGMLDAVKRKMLKAAYKGYCDACDEEK